MKISVQSIYNWYRDTIRNPKYRWWVIAASMIYLLSPFDISPDFLPIIGWLDDGVIATLLVAELSQLLLERLKSGKGSDPQAVNASNPDAANQDAVDVDAVAMK